MVETTPMPYSQVNEFVAARPHDLRANSRGQPSPAGRRRRRRSKIPSATPATTRRG